MGSSLGWVLVNYTVYFSDNRRSGSALGWISGQTYLIKLEDLGDEHYPVISFPSILHLYSYSKLLLSRRANHSRTPLCLLWPPKGWISSLSPKEASRQTSVITSRAPKEEKTISCICGAFAVGSIDLIMIRLWSKDLL